MQIIDLTDKYCKYILKENSLKKYRLSYPVLFRHYFKYWANQKYWNKTLKTPKDVEKNKRLILSRLPYIIKRLSKHSLSVADIAVVLFVGQNTSNGHSFCEKGKWFVWIPIEAYTTKLQVDVFVTHEIIHAIHYSKQKEFYFSNIKEKSQLSRELITEGLATWVTKKVLNISAKKSVVGGLYFTSTAKKVVERMSKT